MADLDTSGFIPSGGSTTGGATKGYGRLSVSQLLDSSHCAGIPADGTQIKVTRTYDVPGPTSKYAILVTELEVVAGQALRNVRLWVGTGDDWIGRSDAPTKILGDFNEQYEFVSRSSVAPNRIWPHNKTRFWSRGFVLYDARLWPRFREGCHR